MARQTLMEVTANVAMMSKAEIITELTKINGDHSGIKNVLATRLAKVVFDNQPPEQVYPSPPRLPGPLTAKLTELKECLHSKLITQEQYNTAVLAVVTPGSTAVTPTESAEASVVGVTSLEDANSKALRELRTLMVSWMGGQSAPFLGGVLWDAFQGTTDEWLRLQLQQVAGSTESGRAIMAMFVSAGRGVVPVALTGQGEGHRLMCLLVRDWLKKAAAVKGTSILASRSPHVNRAELHLQVLALLEEDEHAVMSSIFAGALIKQSAADKLLGKGVSASVVTLDTETPPSLLPTRQLQGSNTKSKGYINNKSKGYINKRPRGAPDERLPDVEWKKLSIPEQHALKKKRGW